LPDLGTAATFEHRAVDFGLDVVVTSSATGETTTKVLGPLAAVQADILAVFGQGCLNGRDRASPGERSSPELLENA